MDTNAKAVTVSLSLVPKVAPTPAGQDIVPDGTAQVAERAERYRLIIEEGPTKGTFVYKTLDSQTGEIVRQFPREEIIRMSLDHAYARGTVANTKV